MASPAAATDPMGSPVDSDDEVPSEEESEDIEIEEEGAPLTPAEWKEKAGERYKVMCS